MCNYSVQIAPEKRTVCYTGPVVLNIQLEGVAKYIIYRNAQ
jgi:hypothetical protein